MPWYAQIVIYSFALFFAFTAMLTVDFNKLMRVNRKQYAFFLYTLLSLALGFLVGLLFVTLGNLAFEAL